MTVTAERKVTVALTGSFVATNEFNAASNTLSPGQVALTTLAPGANTITPPTGGSSPQGVTIIPPTGNTLSITLKGITGDTGVGLHLTDPTSLGLASTTATFVLTASSTIAGVRLIWT
jgi:hypothetical protein